MPPVSTASAPLLPPLWLDCRFLKAWKEGLPGAPTWNHSATSSRSFDGQLSPAVSRRQKQGHLDVWPPCHGKNVREQEGAPKPWHKARCRLQTAMVSTGNHGPSSSLQPLPSPLLPYLLDHPLQKATTNVYFPTNTNCPPGGIGGG